MKCKNCGKPFAADELTEDSYCFECSNVDSDGRSSDRIDAKLLQEFSLYAMGMMKKQEGSN
jgi:hypothetical protein